MTKLYNAKLPPFIFTIIVGAVVLGWYFYVSNSYVVNVSSTTSINIQTSPLLTPEQFNNTANNIISIMKTQGMQSAFEYVANQIQTNASFARDCHPLMHQLGHAAYRYYGGYEQAIKYQNEICNSGYTHGVLESYFGNVTNIAEALQTACGSSNSENFSQWQCFHGLGHGVMLAGNGNNVSQSIKLCQTLSNNFSSSACINGVFMQHFIVEDHDGYIPPVNPTNLSDCFSINTAHKSDCYLYAPTAYLTVNSGNYIEALKWCSGSEPGYVGDCVDGVGYQTMKDNINDPTVALDVCKEAGNYQAECVNGAVGLYAFFYGSSKSAEGLCYGTFVEYENTCQSTINEINFTYRI